MSKKQEKCEELDKILTGLGKMALVVGRICWEGIKELRGNAQFWMGDGGRIIPISFCHGVSLLPPTFSLWKGDHFLGDSEKSCCVGECSPWTMLNGHC